MTSERTPETKVRDALSLTGKIWVAPPPVSVRQEVSSGFKVVDDVRAGMKLLTQKALDEWLKPDLAAEVKKLDIPGLSDVVERIAEALKEQERILIFGDYDCDGVTSTTILVTALQVAHPSPEQVIWSLPTRADGYGLQEVYLGEIIIDRPALVIAVDCGSNDRGPIEQLLAAGIDVVVIDHHQINDDVSDLVPVANPQRGTDERAHPIVGAGMAWLVVRELSARGLVLAEVVESLLDLAAIGTIGDVGKLLGFNRALVFAGGKQLRATKRWGLRLLAGEIDFKLSECTAETVSFQLVPKINAPGRMGDPSRALELLLSNNRVDAATLSREVVKIDASRKFALSEAEARLIAAIDAPALIPPVLICHDVAETQGIAGPLASRMVDRFGRPVIVLAGQGDELSGSARSIGDWDIAAALYGMPEGMLLRRGGHARAAGLVILRANIIEFRQAMADVFALSGIAVPMPAEIDVAAYVGDEPLTLPLAQELDRLGPFGSGNRRPTLQWNSVRATDVQAIGKDGKTLRMFLSGGQNRLLGIMFKADEVIGKVQNGDVVDVAIQLTVERYKGQRQLKMFIKDIRPSSVPG